jgi:hypothetical protein
MRFKPFQPNNLGLIRPLADKSFNRYAPFKSLANGIEHSLDLLVMGTNFTLELSQFLRQFSIG